MAINPFSLRGRRQAAPSDAGRALPLLERGSIPWLLMAALATIAPHASHLPIWLSLLAALFLLWRGWLWQRNERLPARWLLGLLVLAGTAGIGWQYRTLFGRDAGVALIVFFMALKPMEMQRRRDALVVIMLGFFLLLTHYFYSQTILTGLWLLLATVQLTATLIRLHGNAQPAGQIVRYAGVLVAQALPFMLILFLLFPRVAGPLWGLPQDAHSGLSGLSDRMSPGSLNQLIQSGAIAFRARFSGAPPEKSHLYWRGPVLADYDGLTWLAGPTRPDAQNTGSAAPVIETSGQSTAYVITLEPHNQRWLLALDLPIERPENSLLAPTFETLAREPLVRRERYAFRSSFAYVANRQENPRMLQQALRLPAGLNPRSRQLAAEWQSRLQTPERISDAALRLFREEKFFYTLRPPLLGQHAIDDFVFETRRGFCEHYASAYVVLMRAAGIPARVVTGYQGGEINPVDGYLTVRQSDAHAWAEIWLENRGWVRVDPTAAVAPSRIELGIEAALPAGEPLPALVRIDYDWLRTLRHRWEATNNAWNQWVLGYNPQRQRDLLERLGLDNPDWRRMAAALAFLSALTLLIVGFSTLYRKTSVTPAQRAWQHYCRRLEKLGMPRATWEGPFDFAARVSRERPEWGPLTSEAAGYFADLHYGTGTPENLQKLKDCTRRLPAFWRKNIEK